MICGSRARRGSRPRRQAEAGLRLASLAAVAACLLAAAAAAAERPWPPQLELTGGEAADPVLRDLLDRDRQWLQRQSPALLLAPAPADTAALRAWVRGAVRLAAAAGGEAARDGAPPRGAPGARSAPAAADGATPADATPYSGQRDLLGRLRDRWLARGYLQAAVGVDTTGARDQPARVAVAPGPAFRLAAVTVGGDDFPGRAAVLGAWLPQAGEVFRSERYQEAAAGVVAACAELGYPFPVWLTRDVTVDPGRATVVLEAVLVPGPRAHVGRQSATLPTARATDFVVRAAGIGRGSVFRESDLRRGRDRLLARDLYARVDAPLVHLTAARDTVGIVWRVEPLDRPNRLGVVLGLSRREEGGSRLSGQVDLDLPNLAGTGRSLRAGWSDDGQGRSSFGFAYEEPLVLGTPLDGDLALRNEVQEDAYTRFTVRSHWQLPVIAFWGIEAGVGWDRTTYPAGEVEASRRLRGRVAFYHARGDRTRSGWSGMFAVETARRSTSLRPADDGEDAGGDLGAQDTQRLLEVDLDGELWLRPTVSVAARASFREIDAEARPVALAEQYRFGGATTLRGYREDEFRGETAAWGGIELRLGRALRSRVYTFVDVGYFEFSQREGGVADAPLASRSGTRTGFGLGLVTAAAAGRVNLAVGFPGDVDFETAKLHVSLLGSF